MIKPTDMESTVILTVLNTRVIGRKTNSTVMDSRLGPMEQNIKECMSKERNTDKEDLPGLTEAHIKVSL
jgi:hypothetical protein